MKKSIGVIETIGYVAALRAIDMMVKMAYVEVISIEKCGSGMVTVIIEGDIDSVKIALDIGASEAINHGKLIGVNSIAKPLLEIDNKLFGGGKIG